MAIEDISKYPTIKSLLTYEKKSDIAYNKLFLKSKISTSNGDLIVNSTSLGNKYIEYIKNYTKLITLTPEELIRYKFSPKLYCYEKFQTMELWGLLLQINNMTSCTEFKKDTIYTFTDDIFRVLNEILVMEDDRIAENNKTIGE